MEQQVITKRFKDILDMNSQEDQQLIVQRITSKRVLQYQHQTKIRLAVAKQVFLTQSSRKKQYLIQQQWKKVKQNRKQLNRLFSLNQVYQADDFLLQTQEQFVNQPLTQQQVQQVTTQLNNQTQIQKKQQQYLIQKRKQQIKQKVQYRIRIKKDVSKVLYQIQQMKMGSKTKQQYIEGLQKKMKGYTASIQLLQWRKYIQSTKPIFGIQQATQLWRLYVRQRIFLFKKRLGPFVYQGQQYLNCQFCQRVNITQKSFRKHVQQFHYKQMYDLVLAWECQDPQNQTKQFIYVVPRPKIITPQFVFKQETQIIHIQHKSMFAVSKWYRPQQIQLKSRQYVKIYDIQVQKQSAKYLKEFQMFHNLIEKLKQSEQQQNIFTSQQLNKDIFALVNRCAINIHASILGMHGHTPHYHQSIVSKKQLAQNASYLQQKAFCSKNIKQICNKLKTTKFDSQFIGRDNQFQQIQNHLKQSLKKTQSSLLHIWGTNGTGKTSSIQFLLRKNFYSYQTHQISCLNSKTQAALFKNILYQIFSINVHYSCAYQRFVEQIKKSNKHRIFVFDEAEGLSSELLMDLKISTTKCHFILITNLQFQFADKLCQHKQPINDLSSLIVNQKNKDIMFYKRPLFDLIVPFRQYSATQLDRILTFKLGKTLFTSGDIQRIYNKGRTGGTLDMRKCIQIVQHVLEQSGQTNIQDIVINSQQLSTLKIFTYQDKITQALKGCGAYANMVLYRLCQFYELGYLQVQNIFLADIVYLFDRRLFSYSQRQIVFHQSQNGVYRYSQNTIHHPKNFSRQILAIVQDLFSQGIITVQQPQNHQLLFGYGLARFLSPQSMMSLIKNISCDQTAKRQYINPHFFIFDLRNYVKQALKTCPQQRYYLHKKRDSKYYIDSDSD